MRRPSSGCRGVFIFSSSLRADEARVGGFTDTESKKEILRYFSQLKSKEARTRNLQRALQVLSGGDGRFMGRSWNL